MGAEGFHTSGLSSSCAALAHFGWAQPLGTAALRLFPLFPCLFRVSRL